MSQVDLLLPPAAGLPPAKDMYVAEEPSGEQLVNDVDKQVNFPIENGSRVDCASDRRDSLSERENVKPPANNINNCQPSSSRPKKPRRSKKRKWKPYFKLTWVERKKLQDREEKRAVKSRAVMSASGLTLAPYNTTQFLMDDHKLREPPSAYIPPSSSSSTKVNHHSHAKENHPQNGCDNAHESSDEFYSSPEDEEDFLQQQFTEAYKSFHFERLNSMSQEDLVQEFMFLEDHVEILEKSLVTRDECPTETGDDPSKREEQLQKIRVFEVEIRKLTEQNERLRRENEELRFMVRSSSESTAWCMSHFHGAFHGIPVAEPNERPKWCKESKIQ